MESAPLHIRIFYLCSFSTIRDILFRVELKGNSSKIENASS